MALKFAAVMLISGEDMGNRKLGRLACVSAVALMAGATATSEAQAQVGAFGISEQSAYFMGSSYAGAAAGGDISSMYWNPAATATLPGLNTSTNYTGIMGSAKEQATGGLLFGSAPNSTDVGTSALVPSSFTTLQLTDQLYAGIGLNAPFGLVTKPDNAWAGSPLATTTKVFSLDVNPTLAYKITPTLTIGAGLQVEYFEIKLEHDGLAPVGIPSRSYQADDVGVGFTAGVLWQPREGTSLGLGYRSSVNENVSGAYSVPAFGLAAIATANVPLPDSATFSFRQAISSQLTALGTVEWTNWSRLGTVSANSALCGGTCETLNLNYQDSWFYSLGAEYAYSPSLTLRTGVAYDRGPITDSIRDILLPDADRVYASVGATYKWSDKLSINVSYSHLFFDDQSFCMATNFTLSAQHCTAPNVTLLSGTADTSVDIVSLGVNYKIYGPEPLEPLK